MRVGLPRARRCPLSITPSAKNFTTPPRHSRPRSVAQRQLRLHLLVGRLRRHPQRDPQAHGQLVGALEVAQQVVRGRLAVHHVRAGEAERVEPLQLGDVAGAQLRPAQLRARRAGRGPARSSRAARPWGRRARRRPPRSVGEGARPVDLRQLERPRRGERRCAGRRAARTRRRRRPRRRCRGSMARRRSRGPRRTASPGCDGARGERREHLLGGLAVAEIDARGPAPRPRTGAGGSRSARGSAPARRACRTSVRASQCARTSASSPTATIVPWRTATAVANGRAGSSVRIAGADDREISGHRAAV